MTETTILLIPIKKIGRMRTSFDICLLIFGVLITEEHIITDRRK